MVVFLPTVALARGFRCFLFFVGRFFEEEKETTLERKKGHRAVNSKQMVEEHNGEGRKVMSFGGFLLYL